MAHYVFPDVELRLRELGLTFDVVDLRWGMTDAFGDNHGATVIRFYFVPLFPTRRNLTLFFS